MNNDRYILLSKDPHTGQTRKKDCPVCGARRRFVEYYDNITREYVTGAGKCDRVNECGAHILVRDVRDYKRELSAIEYKRLNQIQQHKTQQQQHQILPLNGVFNLWNNSTPAVFMQFLQSFFVPETITDVLQAYNVTGVPDEVRAVSFWQQHNGIYTTARVMNYTPDGHRDKNNITWVHTICQQAGKLPTDYQPPKYLFGAHLIERGARVLIVESEKTAILATLFNRRYPCNSICGKYDVITATGGAMMIKQTTNNNRDKLKFATSITLSPDIDASPSQWQDFAKAHNWQVDTAHAQLANKIGYDLGDYVIDLIKQDYLQEVLQ